MQKAEPAFVFFFLFCFLLFLRTNLFNCSWSTLTCDVLLGENKNKKDSAMAASPLWVSEELEYWDSNIRFTHIAATYSELVAISTQGQLHQWRWADAHPYQRTDVSFTFNITKKKMFS